MDSPVVGWCKSVSEIGKTIAAQCGRIQADVSADRQ